MWTSDQFFALFKKVKAKVKKKSQKCENTELSANTEKGKHVSDTPSHSQLGRTEPSVVFVVITVFFEIFSSCDVFETNTALIQVCRRFVFGGAENETADFWAEPL